MVRGVRSGSQPFPFYAPADPQAAALYDPELRRAVRYVETIVPTLNLGESTKGAHMLADRYFCNFGALDATGSAPDWMGGQTNCDFQQWDATDKRFYARMSNAASVSLGTGSAAFIHYAGPFGVATTHAPKNFPDVTKVIMEFRGRFNSTTATGTSNGIGCQDPGNTHLIRLCTILDGTTKFGLVSGDGSSSTGSASGTAVDTNMHDWRIEWDADEIRLYMDASLIQTKTNTRPSKPMECYRRLANNTETFDLVDFGVRWS